MSSLKYILFGSFLFSLSSYSLLQAHHRCGEDRTLQADYVIVGVGTAGATLAKKLTDDHKTSVIALHIGENLTQDPLIKFTENVPITVIDGLIGPPFYETGETTPQPNANNRELIWSLALPEGGASSINAGAYCRGTDQIYAQWEAVAGPEWSVRRISSLYKNLENYHGETTNPKTRGHHGPLEVRQVPLRETSQTALTFSQAMIAGTGFPFVLDYNDPLTPIGVSPQFQYTQKGPRGALRVSSATAFLNKKVMTPDGHGVNGRKLRVLFESRALRTIWEGNKAIGVEYLTDGEIKQVFAKKGVIVCAGLYSSAFLQYSGVGPASVLAPLGIPVIFNNPNVGQGLADQNQVLALFTTNPLDFPTENDNIFSQIAWLPAPGGDPTKRVIRLSTTTPFPGLSVMLVDLCQPKSRGSIIINSPNPLAPPVIDLGEFTNPDDLFVYVATFQTYIKNINNALRTIDPAYQLILPDPAILDDAGLIIEYVKSLVASNQCFQCHCRMAPFEQGGVVDSTGHVYGVQNLIVADDSIVPVAMDGTPMASAYLIAANIARLLQKR